MFVKLPDLSHSFIREGLALRQLLTATAECRREEIELVHCVTDRDTCVIPPEHNKSLIKARMNIASRLGIVPVGGHVYRHVPQCE